MPEELDTDPVEIVEVTLHVVNHDELGWSAIKRAIECASYPNRCISPYVHGLRSKVVDWHDGHPINQRRGGTAAAQALFAEGGDKC